MHALDGRTLSRLSRCQLLILVVVPLLVACSRPAMQLTYRDLHATAVVTGCWPGNFPTPNPVTGTPRASMPTASGTRISLPTTTPLPRCTPMAGAPALAPYPTTAPTPVPHPTQRPIIINGGNALVTALELPTIHHVDVAAHPTEGWAAVASVWTDDYHGSDGGPSRRIFVRVFNPGANAWGVARQVNPPPAENGNGYYGGVALAITGDGSVHVVWGGAFTPGKPVWYAQSRDYGATWSPPQQIGHDCYSVANLEATPDGQLVVLALCSPPEFLVRPGFIVRSADGTWLPQEEIAIDGRWGSLIVLGDGPDARAVALMTAANGRSGFVLQKRLSDAGPWQVQSVSLEPPPGLYASTATAYLFRGTTFRRPNGQDGIIFTWSVYGGNAVHALTSLDGGQSWGSIETIAAYASVSDANDPPPDHRWSAPAYDARSDRVIMFLVRRDLDDVAWPGNGTHFAFWSVPGSGVWTPRQGPEVYEPVIPLISGATSASWTDTAQTANSSFVWLAWVNRWKQLQVRSLDLNLIIPPDQYPLPTPRDGVSP